MQPQGQDPGDRSEAIGQDQEQGADQLRHRPKQTGDAPRQHSHPGMRRQRRGSGQGQGRRDHHRDDRPPQADLQRLQQLAENPNHIAKWLDQIVDGFCLDLGLKGDGIEAFGLNRPRLDAAEQRLAIRVEALDPTDRRFFRQLDRKQGAPHRADGRGDGRFRLQPHRMQDRIERQRRHPVDLDPPPRMRQNRQGDQQHDQGLEAPHARKAPIAGVAPRRARFTIHGACFRRRRRWPVHRFRRGSTAPAIRARRRR
ncbi:hypothetical protein D3C86_930980 [compost metagenome]